MTMLDATDRRGLPLSRLQTTPHTYLSVRRRIRLLAIRVLGPPSLVP